MVICYTGLDASSHILVEADHLVLGGILWAVDQEGAEAIVAKAGREGKVFLYGRRLTTTLSCQRLWVAIGEKQVEIMAYLANGMQAHIECAHHEDYVVAWLMEDGELDRIVARNDAA